MSTVAIADAYRNIVVTTGTGSGGVPGTNTAKAVDAQLNLDAGFGISLVADVANNKVTIVNTGNGTGALTTITDNNSSGNFYPIFTRPPPGTQTFTTADSDYVSCTVPNGVAELRITGSINDPSGVSSGLRAALVGLITNETLQGIRVLDGATLNFTATGPATYSTVNGYWTVPITIANGSTDTLSSITIATGAGELNPLTGTYQMDTMYLDQTTTPMIYNPSTSTLSLSNVLTSGSLQIGTNGYGVLNVDTSLQKVGINITGAISSDTVLQVENQVAGESYVRIRNLSGDSDVKKSTGIKFDVHNGATVATRGTLIATSATWAYGQMPANAVVLATKTGAIAIAAAGGGNGIKFYTGDSTDGWQSTERMAISETGVVSVVNNLLIGSNANLTDWPNAKLVSSQANTGDTHSYNIGVVGEAQADAVTSTIWGVGVYGKGSTNVGTRSAGVLGDGGVTNTADTGSAIGVRGYSNDVHAGGLNIGLYGEASNSATGNYALAMGTGNILSTTAQTWTLFDNQVSALSIDADGKAGILVIKTTNAAEGVTMSGTLAVTGHVTVEGVTSTGATGTGKFVFDNAPTISGHPTIEGVTSTGATGTGKFVFDTSPTISGGSHTSITSLGIRDTSAAFDVTVAATSSTTLTAGRTLTLDVVNAARTLKLGGNISVGANFTTDANGTISIATTGNTSVTLPTTGTLYGTASGSITATQLATSLSSTYYTGTVGKFVFDTSPTIAGGSITGLTTLAIRDTSAAFDVTLAATSSTALTAGRSITIDVINAARTIKLAGNIDLANNLTTAGNFALTLTTTATTNATLPAGTVTLYGTGSGTITSSQLATSVSDETGSGSLVFGTNPSLTAPTWGNTSNTTDGDYTLDASLYGYSSWIANFTAGRALNVSNLATGRRLVIYIRNTNGTARAITVNASATTSGFATVNLAVGAGAVSATSVTLAATSGTAVVYIWNAGGNLVGMVN